MLCFRCGSPVSDAADTCDNCGQDLSNSASPDTAKFAELQKKLRETGREWRRPTSSYDIGQVVAERYEINDVVGAGPLGTVYKAFDQEVEVDVALKVISNECLSDEEARNHFLLTLQSTRDLVHENVVRCFDVDHEGDKCFYVMQFLKGLTLRKIIDMRRAKGQRFSVDEVGPIVGQLCRALNDTAPIMVHGGLKPDNIVILPDLLKITDFGLPEALPRSAYLSAQRAYKDVAHYLAPEVLDGLDHDRRTDVYSVGVIVTELLSGKLYVGGDIAIHSQVEDVPLAVDDVLTRAVSTDPEQRQPRSSDLEEQLNDALGNPARTAVPEQIGADEAAMEAPDVPDQDAVVTQELPASPVDDVLTTGKYDAPKVTDLDAPADLDEPPLIADDDAGDDDEEQTARRPAPEPDPDSEDEALDFSDPSVPAPTKEKSQVTQQLEIDDIEFASQSAKTELPVDGGEDEDDFLAAPAEPAEEGTAKVDPTQMEEQIQESEDELRLSAPEGPPPERTQQIDPDMIVDPEETEEEPEPVLLVPPGDINHSEIAGETDDAVPPPVEEAAEPSYRQAANLSEKVLSEDSINKEARAREALQAFDFDATLQAAVEKAHVAEPDEEQAVPLPKTEERPNVVTPDVALVARGTLEVPVAGAQPLVDEEGETMVVAHDAVERPPATRLVPVMIVAFVLVLALGTAGAIYFITKQRSVDALKELERKRVAMVEKDSAPVEITPDSRVPTVAAVPLPTSEADAAVPPTAPAPTPKVVSPTPTPAPTPTPKVVKLAPKPTPTPAPTRPRPALTKKLPTRAKIPKDPPRPRPPAPKASSNKCPGGMRYVPGRGSADGYCIDRYEFPGRGRVPKRTSLGGAKAGCSARGLRLCTAKEWIRACGGLFPYGRKYDPKRCNTGGAKPVASGSRRRCRSRWGLYDMSGNVAEWVAGGAAMGGDARAKEGHAGCMARTGGGGLTGFRCCSDPEWD